MGWSRRDHVRDPLDRYPPMLACTGLIILKGIPTSLMGQ
jgi:hypothetical protein